MSQVTGKPKERLFTVQTGVVISISSSQRRAINDRPFPKRTDFGPAVCSYRQTYASARLYPAIYSGNDSLFYSEYCQVL